MRVSSRLAKSGNSPKIVIAANTSWNLVNFRSGLIAGLQKRGFHVTALAPRDEHSVRLAALGCNFIPIPMQNHGTSASRDALLMLRFLAVMRRLKPAAYLGYTIKPNVYGSLAANMVGVPVINNIAGLGVAFSRSSAIQRIAQTLYRISLRRSAKTFFQNAEDRDLFVSRGIVRALQTDLLPGSGVDLDRFAPRPASKTTSETTFLLVARLLWEKGIGDYVDAARALRASGSGARFRLLGFLAETSPTGIPRAILDGWIAEGIIDYLGVSDDVRPHLAASDCVVLPSYYREGTPRSLLEAAAMGKPIITTDSAGCRTVVDDGVNGFLCEPKSAGDLQSKMLRFMALLPEAKQAMGAASRSKAVAEFDEDIVITKYLQTLADIGVSP